MREYKPGDYTRALFEQERHKHWVRYHLRHTYVVVETWMVRLGLRLLDLPCHLGVHDWKYMRGTPGNVYKQCAHCWARTREDVHAAAPERPDVQWLTGGPWTDGWGSDEWGKH